MLMKVGGLFGEECSDYISADMDRAPARQAAARTGAPHRSGSVQERGRSGACEACARMWDVTKSEAVSSEVERKDIGTEPCSQPRKRLASITCSVCRAMHSGGERERDTYRGDSTCPTLASLAREACLVTSRHVPTKLSRSGTVKLNASAIE